MKEILDLVCFCCRNHNCDYYTMYRGYLMCEYCLDDWMKDGQNDFELWCIQHKEELDRDAFVENSEVKEKKQ